MDNIGREGFTDGRAFVVGKTSGIDGSNRSRVITESTDTIVRNIGNVTSGDGLDKIKNSATEINAAMRDFNTALANIINVSNETTASQLQEAANKFLTNHKEIMDQVSTIGQDIDLHYELSVLEYNDLSTGMQELGKTKELVEVISKGGPEIVAKLKEICEASGQSKEAFEASVQNAQQLVDKIKQVGQQTTNMSQQASQVIAGMRDTVTAIFQQIGEMNGDRLGAQQYVNTLLSTMQHMGDAEMLNAIAQTQEKIKAHVTNGTLHDFDTQSAVANLINELTQPMTMIQESQSMKNSSIEIQRQVAESNLEYLQQGYKTLERIATTNEYHAAKEYGDQNAKNIYTQQAQLMRQAMEKLKQNIEGARTVATNTIKQSIDEGVAQQTKNFQALNDPESKQRRLVDFGIAESNYGTVGGNLNNLSGLAASSLDALANRQSPNPLYRHVTTGNLFGDTNKLRENLQHAQRVSTLSSMQWEEHTTNLANAKQIGDRKTMSVALEGMKNVAVNNSEATQQIAKDMSLTGLMHGGGKNLTPEDKKIFDNFQKQIESSLANVNAAIRAIEAIDPQNEDSLKALREQQSKLLEIRGNVEEIKDKSSGLSEHLKGIWDGVQSFKNLLAGGLSMFGLGALLSPLQFISGGIKQEENEGKRRYAVAKNMLRMGVAPNDNRIMEFARYGKEYFAMTNGMIADDEYMKYYINLSKSVGGHYGASPEAGESDMAQIARTTFAISKVYDISESSVASAMRTFYKDFGMSASEASMAMVNMAQTAISAGIPTEQYLNTVSKMADKLREYGTSGRQTMA